MTRRIFRGAREGLNELASAITAILWVVCFVVLILGTLAHFP